MSSLAFTAWFLLWLLGYLLKHSASTLWVFFVVHSDEGCFWELGDVKSLSFEDLAFPDLRSTYGFLKDGRMISFDSF